MKKVKNIKRKNVFKFKNKHLVQVTTSVLGIILIITLVVSLISWR